MVGHIWDYPVSQAIYHKLPSYLAISLPTQSLSAECHGQARDLVSITPRDAANCCEALADMQVFGSPRPLGCTFRNADDPAQVGLCMAPVYMRTQPALPGLFLGLIACTNHCSLLLQALHVWVGGGCHREREEEVTSKLAEGGLPPVVRVIHVGGRRPGLVCCLAPLELTNCISSFHNLSMQC